MSYTVANGWDQELTERAHNIMRNLPDDEKMRFVINWKMPHTLFNVACGMPQHFDMSIFNNSSEPPATRKMVCWWSIFKSRDLGTWSTHGGRVMI